MLSVIYDVANYLTISPINASYKSFYSAEDTDSYLLKTDIEKKEGTYYVWSLKTLYVVF